MCCAHVANWNTSKRVFFLHAQFLCVRQRNVKPCDSVNQLKNVSFCFRRQHVVGWTTTNSGQQTPKDQMNGGAMPPSTPHLESSPEKLRTTTNDLFELLERAQSSRLDDQRCVLPAYFSQVSLFIFLFQIILCTNVHFHYECSTQWLNNFHLPLCFKTNDICVFIQPIKNNYRFVFMKIQKICKIV